MTRDVAEISLTTDITCFFTIQLQQSLGIRPFTENTLFFFSKRSFPLLNPQNHFSCLPLTCHERIFHPGEYLVSPTPVYFCLVTTYSQSYLAILVNTSVNQRVARTYQAPFSVTNEELLDISNSPHTAYLEQSA